MGPADSRRITRAPRYSGAGWGTDNDAYGAFTLRGATFQMLPQRRPYPVSPVLLHRDVPCGTARFGLFPVRSPLLGESLSYFLFLQVLRCFSSLRSPHRTSGDSGHYRPEGCPIRKFPHQWLFAPTRNLSQLITSFIASLSLGIRHTPFSSFFRLPYRSLPRGFRVRVHTFSCSLPTSCSYHKEAAMRRNAFLVLTTVSLVSICQRSCRKF